jgi:CHAT domain-containing protein
MSLDSESSANLVDDLLSLPTLEQQSRFLRNAGLLDAEGLDRLLGVADRLLNDDPGKARRLAELCADLSDDADAPAAVPRANYIRAGAHNLNGEFEADLRLTRAAHDGYVALGMNLEALRTNVGKMAALLELGRYQETLDAGQVVLDALGGKGEIDVTPTPREANLLDAMVYQNSGGCYEYMGRYDEALDAYSSAEERYRSLGMSERLGEILDNRGAILLYLGRGSEALMAHEEAAAVFERAQLTLSYAKALGNIGETHLHLGNYRRSLEMFERVHHLLNSLGEPVDKHLLLRHTADAYLALNLYSEALSAYREVDGLLREVGMVHERAQALWGMGSALAARSELGEAGRALDEAAVLFEEAGNAPLLSGVMLEQAALLEARGDHEAALAAARRALELVSAEDRPVQQVYAHLRIADLLLPDAASAEPHLLTAQRVANRLALPHLSYRLKERLGHLRRLQGRQEEAWTLLETAVEEIERLRGTVTQDAMRTSFLRDKTAAYEDLLQLHLDRGGDEGSRRAFTVAERAKSRALVDLLVGVTEKESAATKDPELRKRLQDLQADLNAIYNRMLGRADDGHGASLPVLHDRAAELEREISRLRLQAAATSSDPFATSVSPEDLPRRFPSDVALLAYHVVGDEVLAFVNSRGSTRVARNLGTVTTVRRLLQRLAVQWDRFRAGQEFARRHMALLERSARQVLSALHAELVAPLEPLLGEATDRVHKLVIVPHGPLHQVPFHALFDGRQYLLERFEISYAPSAAVYALCQGRPTRDSGRAVVFGVEDPLIPAATSEAYAIAERISGSRAYVGEWATIAALRSEAAGCDTLHLACHGLFRSDNPMFSSLKLHDGWLMAADAMQLDLNGALITLSACESGRAGVIGGDETLGLTRAFLGAGAATMVVSLWVVQDEATAALMDKWYAHLHDGKERATALRAAQLEIKERHPHPYYWAPFVIIGKR